jgi:uncharacterized protein YecA (UPF0149 family)
MPLNEARSFKRSNLTREQKQQAEAAIYGVRESTSMSPSNLTQQEIESMRALVAQHDNEGKISEFDLNKPPKVPYRHQDFPRMVYNHKLSAPSRVDLVKGKDGDVQERHVEPKIVSKIVHDEDELEAALEAGWSKEVPPLHSEAAIEGELAVEESEEIESPRRSKGKKAKKDAAE